MPTSRTPTPRASAPAQAARRREAFTEAVLAVAGMVPAACVLSYGDVAELLGAGGPRQVGAVMSGHGSSVCWWRIIRADGSLPDDLAAGARPRWEAEGTSVRQGRVLMSEARWQPTEAQFDALDALGARLREQNSGGR